MPQIPNESGGPVDLARMGGKSSLAQIVYHEPVPEQGAGTQGTLEGLWEVLLARKWVLAGGALLFVFAAAVITMLQTPVFESRATVEIQTAREVSPNLTALEGAEAPSAADGFMQTQIRILQSQSMRQRVETKLASGGGRNPYWTRRPNKLQTLAARFGIEAAFLRPAVVDGAPPAKLTIHILDGTRLLEIVCDSPDEVYAAQYVNTLASEFREAQMESRWAGAQSASKWLNEQIQDVQQKLRQSEHDLESLTRQAGLMLNSDLDSADQAKLKQLQEELSRAIGDRVLKQAAFETAQNSPSDAVPQVIDDGRLSVQKAKLADLRRELAEMRSQMTPEHYRVKQVSAQIDEVEATLSQERQTILLRMRNDYNAAVRRESLLRATYDGQQGVVSRQSQRGVSADLLRREVESDRKLYDELLAKAKGADLASAVRVSTVQVIDPALPSKTPVKPDLPRNLMMGLVSGLLLAAIFAVGADHTNRRLRSPGETAFHLGVPELGVIPEHESLHQRKSSERKSILSLTGNSADGGGPQPLAGWQNDPTLVTESFRGALTSIMRDSRRGRLSPVILVTSCSRGEGKSTTISNLACAMAEIKRKVVVIDADMRKPQLHHIYGVANTWGLGDLLKDQNALAEVPLECLTRPTAIDGLHLIPSGPGAANSWTLLNSSRMAELVDRLRKEYEAVLIDTPPMSYIPDARVLGRLADGVVLVVRAGETTRDQALAAKQRLQEDGIAVLGTILNRWDPKSRARYGYYAYGSEAELAHSGVRI